MSQAMDKPKALTIKELKLMIGKPVFVVRANRKEWCLIHSFHVSEVYGGGIIVTTKTSQKITLPYHEFCISWRAYDKEWLHFEDAVPVVRCADCIYWSSKRSMCNNLRGLYSQTKETDFCSWGERKENEKI